LGSVDCPERSWPKPWPRDQKPRAIAAPTAADTAAQRRETNTRPATAASATISPATMAGPSVLTHPPRAVSAPASQLGAVWAAALSVEPRARAEALSAWWDPTVECSPTATPRWSPFRAFRGGNGYRLTDASGTALSFGPAP
jgi:hypothetical protein